MINSQSLSEQTRIIFLTAPPINEEQIRESLGYCTALYCTSRLGFLCAVYIILGLVSEMGVSSSENRAIVGDLGRRNELCRIYSEACLEVCREVGVEAVDLWTAIQQRDDWSNVCFT